MPRSLDAGEHFARGVVHENSTRARAPDVAFDVTLHAVGDAALGAGVLIKEPPITQAAVGLHVVHPDQPLAAAVHVKQLLVRGETKSVRVDNIVDHERHYFCLLYTSDATDE